MLSRSLTLMMILLCLVGGSCSQVCAQTILPPEMPESTGEVQVKKLSEDSLSTAYYIKVYDEVQPHYHSKHSEHIVVVEGTGLMRMNNHTIALVPGTHVFIPSGTIHSVKVTSDIPLGVLSIQTPMFDPSDRISVEE